MVQYFLKPQPQDKRNVSQADILNNFTYLQNSIGIDHNFTANTVNATDGYHKIIHYVNQAGALGSGTPAPIAGIGQLYTKTVTTSVGAGEHLFYQQGSNAVAATECCLTAVPPRAAVSFISTGAIQGTSYNVSNVAYTALGNIYTLTFPNAMPGLNYIVSAVRTSGTAGLSWAVGTKTTTTCQILVSNTAGTGSGLVAGFDVIVFGG